MEQLEGKKNHNRHLEMLSAAITNFRLEIFLAKSMSVFKEMWNRGSLFTEM